MKTLKEIISEFNYEVEFPFLGQTFVVSKERTVNNQIRIKYGQLADNAKSIFAGRIAKYDSPEALLNGLALDFLTAMKDSFDELTKDAISVDCYTLDMEAAIKLCTKKGYFDAYDKAVREYQSAYNSILQKHIGNASNVYNNAANHPTLQVSTIGGGVGDAIGNQLKADFTNAVIGEAYSAAAALKVSEIMDKSDKEVAQFFANPTYKNNIINSVWTCASNLRLVITNYLNDECDLELSGWVSIDDSTKAESMFNNFNSIKLPEDKEKEFALNILQLNPYNYNYYKTLLTKFIDSSGEILAIADYFNISLTNALKIIIDRFALDNMGSSFEELKQCRKLVKDKIAELGYPEDSNELAEKAIQIQGANLVKKYMSDNMGDTRESALKCIDDILDIEDDIGLEEKYRTAIYEEIGKVIEALDKQLVDELTKWVNENIGTTEDDAHRCREELDKIISEKELDPEKATELYNIIDTRLKKLDEEYRTVEGFTFPTRESADETRAVIKEHRDILYKDTTEFIFRNDYLAHIEKIKTVPLIDKLIDHFTERYEKYLREFDKRCRNAKLYDDKRSGQKKSLKSLARSMFVSDDQQQRDWEAITHNGQYSIQEIIGDADISGISSSLNGLKGLFGKK